MVDDTIRALRHGLHRCAEVSHKEAETAALIERFLRTTNPDQLITGLGGHGVLAVFDGIAPGPTVLLRSELDALPIDETLAVEYASRTSGVSHKCGHDGHMAMLSGVARELAHSRPAQGRIALLFQPTEETGEGAVLVLADNPFEQIRPDWAFALHNLPGFPAGEVLLRDGPFACGSRGIAVNLRGATAHAAEPERGKSPALAVSALIAALSAVPQSYLPLHEGAKVTVIHVRMGEVAFGTTPGEAVVMATMRANGEEVLDQLEEHCRRLGQDVAEAHGLTATIEMHEPFPVTSNHPGAVELVRVAAEAVGLSTRTLDHPFGWSEDFGHFTAHFRGALFGMGAGSKHPALHHPSYDFPDELLDRGIRLLHRLSLDACGSTHQASGS